MPTSQMKTIFQILLLLALTMAFTSHIYANEKFQDIIRDQRIAIKEGRLDDVIDYGKIALAAYRNGQSDTIIWHALDMGGDACVSTRRYIEALDFYMASVEFGDKNANNHIKALGLNNIGNIHETFGDYERALHYFTKSYESALAYNDSYMLAASLLNLVNVCSLLGDLNNATKYYNLLQKYSHHTPEETLFWRYLSKVSLDLANKNYHEA